jgi:tetratricopeptide (TPR) repeat protein
MGIAIQLIVLGIDTRMTGQLEEAEHSLRESIAMCQEIGHLVNIADGLLTLAWVFQDSGKFTEAHRLLEESASRFSDLGIRHRFATANWSLGEVSMDLGLYGQARTQTEMGCTLFREVGDQHGVAGCHLSLGRLALVREAYAEARQLLERSVALYREIGEQFELCWAPATLGNAVRALGQLSQARRHTCEALRGAAEAGVFAPAVMSLAHSALLLADQGEPERAVELYALASRHPMVGHSRYWEDVVGRHIAAVAAALPSDVVTAAQERGRARDLHATVAELLVELGEEQGGA